MDVLTEAAAEDLSIMAGGDADEKPYFAASAWEHARHRVVWLLILMLSAAITGSIITRYEDAISAYPSGGLSTHADGHRRKTAAPRAPRW